MPTNRSAREKRIFARFELETHRSPDLLDIIKEKLGHIGACFLVLLICAIAALGLSSLFWHFFEEKVFGDGNVPKNCVKRIVGYYNLNSPVQLRDSQLSRLTHVILYPLDVGQNGTLFFKSKEREQKVEKLIKKLKQSYVKAMFSIGDEKTGSWKFSSIAMESRRKETVFDSILHLVRKFGFDGVDVNWQWPKTPQEKATLLFFLQELRERLTALSKSAEKKKPYLISVVCDNHIDEVNHPQFLKYADFLNLFTENYYGEWESHGMVGPPSPLYTGDGIYFVGNVNSTVVYWACTIKEPRKLNIVVPFRGRYWNNVIDNREAHERFFMTAEPLNGEVDGGLVTWREIKNNGWDISLASWDPETRSSYIWNNTNKSVLSFESERSLEEKVKYAVENNIGGFTVWKLNDDDDDDTLFKIISSSEFCSKRSENRSTFNCDKRWKK
ncbi:unnamed protein product [Caenorhabditis brenneri]